MRSAAGVSFVSTQILDGPYSNRKEINSNAVCKAIIKVI